MNGNFGMVSPAGQAVCPDTDMGGQAASGKSKTTKSALAFGGSSFLTLFSLLMNQEPGVSEKTAGDPSSSPSRSAVVSVSGKSPFSREDGTGENGPSREGRGITAGMSRWPTTVEPEAVVGTAVSCKVEGG